MSGLDLGLLLPPAAETGLSSVVLLRARLERAVAAGKWREIARLLADIRPAEVGDMAEFVEELFEIMRELAGQAAVTGYENLYKELLKVVC